MQQAEFLTAREAADELGVSVTTLYAYVSRGLLHSVGDQADPRRRRYPAVEIKRIQERQLQRRDPARAVGHALHWGLPILDSAITLIDAGNLYFRGLAATELAVDWTVEQVAALLWLGKRDAFRPEDWATTAPFGEASNSAAPTAVLPPIERLQHQLSLMAAADLAALDLRPVSVARTGARILTALASIATGQHPSTGGIASTLAATWCADDPGALRLLSAALILCADHELNVSSFTARCVASAGSNPYAVVLAGLAALQGVKHGGHTARVEALFREVDVAGDPRDALAGRVRRGEQIPGFGHPLYPNGDPRCRLLLDLLTNAYPRSPLVGGAFELASSATLLLNDHPTIDFGLVTVARVLGLPPGGALTIFAVGRTLGWIAHAIEQYTSDELIRPRARYVGPPPTHRHQE